ncbi:MAG: LCP family protein [Eubacterium sp.]|nr:LCP family protein [Eubacterium sp.]
MRNDYSGREQGRMAPRMPKRAMSPGFIKFTRIWSIVYILMLALFLFTLLSADILPLVLLIPIVVLIACASMLIFPQLFFANIKKSRKIIALVISCILIPVYAYGAIGLGTVAGFFSAITGNEEQTVTFLVITRKDSSLKELPDLEGKNVGTYINEEPVYMAARKKLADEVSVNYMTSPSITEMASSTLVGGFDATLMTKSHYDMLRDKDKDFRKNTKVLHKFGVKMDEADLAKRVKVTKEPFNIYISGLDVSGTIDVTSRSDVNMIMTVNPETHKILLTSIPRDTVIHMNEKGGASDKLTHTGIYGIGCSLGAVEDLTGLDMNYYVKVNYTTVKKMVDALGGIDVKSDYEFDTHGMKAKFHFKKGWNHLDGEHALAFARERKSFPDGDIQRNRNQAKVMTAMLKKATSSRTILMNYTTILNSTKDYMQTNMSQKEIKSLVKMQIALNPKWKIRRQNMEGPSAFMQCYSTGSYEVSVVQVSDESLKKCVKRIKRIINPPEED